MVRVEENEVKRGVLEPRRRVQARHREERHARAEGLQALCDLAPCTLTNENERNCKYFESDLLLSLFIVAMLEAVRKRENQRIGKKIQTGIYSS